MSAISGRMYILTIKIIFTDELKMTKKITRAILLTSALSVALSGCGMFASSDAPNQDEPALSSAQNITANQPTPLMNAAAAGDLSELQDLVGDGANVNTVTPEGTALSWAIDKQQQVSALYLMSVGATPDKGVETGATSLLMKVSDQGDKRLVKALLAAGADVNYSDTNGESAIAYASYKGHLTIVKALLKAGADVNVSPKGQSLLMHIVSNNDLLLAQVVIAAGADVNFTDDQGNTALKVAQEKGLSDLEMLLVQSGATS